ncbi:MAG TPA: KTSC domain-containing protein [Rhizomicrobium sp.]|nr:KTSC domain-containing protein [Rhizomicrobium sp.]
MQLTEYLLMERTVRAAVLSKAMYVHSTLIEAVAYDEKAHLLQARFRESGETVVYENVPQEVYDSLIFADSIAGFFRDHIEGHFPRRRHH